MICVVYKASIYALCKIPKNCEYFLAIFPHFIFIEQKHISTHDKKASTQNYAIV